MKLCPCGCGQEIGARKGKKWATDLCRYRARNHQRYERQKQATALAIQILETQGYQVKKGGK